jgi:hypothetical protein
LLRMLHILDYEQKPLKELRLDAIEREKLRR